MLRAAIVTAPILLLLSSIAFAAGGGIDDDQLGGAIQVYAFAAFALAFVGLRGMVENEFPRGSAALTLVGVVGAIGGSCFGIVAITSELNGIHLQDAQDVSVQLALFLPGNLFAPALIGFGLALHHARVGRPISAPALIVGAVLFPISRIATIEPLAIAADLILVLALVSLGRTASAPLSEGARA
jgi:hypothetical protein